MKVKKCELCGMFYDEEKFGEGCPFCSENKINNQNKDIAEMHERREESTKESATMVIGDEFPLNLQYEEKPSVEEAMKPDQDEAIFSLNNINSELEKMKPIEKKQRPSDDMKTQGFFGTIRPVVGWLVAIKGPHIGSSFEIHEGKNSIGRGFELDIQLSQDTKISRSACLYIVFDRKSFNFYLTPGDSNMLAYYEEEPVLQPIQILEKNSIFLGDTQLILISFCDKNHDWESYLQYV